MERLSAVQRIFRDVFDDDSLVISPETTAADVPGWDSVAQVKLLLTVESEFGVRLATAEVQAIRSVGDMLAAVERHAGS